MKKVSITLLIIIFGVSYFFINKNKKLESSIKKSNITKDSLIVEINKRDSLIDRLSELNDSLILKKVTLKVKESDDNVVATWYQAHGDKTYSGEIFHKDSLTAAYPVKMGTYLKVTNKNNGKSVIVRVTDRMGSRNKNKIDLSKKAFEEIANKNSGRIKVTVEIIE